MPTQAEINQANKLKEEGNELVKAGKLDDAIIKYNDAIKFNRDPIYFCNRYFLNIIILIFFFKLFNF